MGFALAICIALMSGMIVVFGSKTGQTWNPRSAWSVNKSTETLVALRQCEQGLCSCPNCNHGLFRTPKTPPEAE